MTEDNQAAADVSKSRKGVMTALLAILLVIAAIVGVAYAMELGPFAPPAAEPVEEAPEQPAEEPAAEETETPAPSITTLPSAEAQEVMYWEQIASAEQIADLVDDKFASFELGQKATNTETADIKVTGTYRDGGTLSGWILLRKYNESWFFARITRDGNPTTAPVSGAVDMAVAKAIAEGNAANQEIPVAILDGGYTKITIDKVAKGSGTALVDATFSGGSLPEATGQITCISKDVGGVTKWFITGFAKS